MNQATNPKIKPPCKLTHNNIKIGSTQIFARSSLSRRSNLSIQTAKKRKVQICGLGRKWTLAAITPKTVRRRNQRIALACSIFED
jgi:hypothetical protein